MKKILLSTMFGLFFAISSFAQSGYCGADGNGTNLTWSISGNVLTISGTGRMAGYDSSNGVPWRIYRQSIERVVIGNSVTSIGSRVFSYCSNLSSITIPASVTSIGSYAFSYCSSLKSITIPAGVTSIGLSAFSYCSNLSSITIPAGVTSIGNDAFYYCSSLTSITIPAGVTSIGDWVFRGCSSLTSITIPAGVTSIGRYAFSYCTSLSSITIPASVTTIDSYAFYYCTSLTNITVNWEMPIVSGIAFRDVAKDATLVVPAGAKANYEVADYWKDFGAIIEPEGKDDDDPTSNTPLSLCNIHASYTGGTLSIDSPSAETIRVYSLNGSLVYTATKGEGGVVFLVNLSSGIYIVTGSSGWSMKVAASSFGG